MRWSVLLILAACSTPRLEARPNAVSMAELKCDGGVTVAEVDDYVFGGYAGSLSPSPPHADGNPKRAFIVLWKKFPYRLVFSHEGSYCPWFEFPSGAGFCYQFFEGNDGWAELFNDWGRKEKNSFVDVLERGPKRVWIHWTYFGVNQKDGTPAYRGSEDFWCYPNGLVLRRQSFESLLPGKHHGYAREPIEMIGMCPVGKTWADVLRPIGEEHHALAALDPFSSRRYDVFWRQKGLADADARRSGCAWKELDDSPGIVLAVPMREGAPFCVFGDASGFDHAWTRIKEHSHKDTGGIGWVSSSWDHWPIGWLNSQEHPVDEKSVKQYPNHFSPAGMDFFALPNKKVERRDFYSLIGISADLEVTRRLALRWLEQGPQSAAELRP